MLRDRIRAVLLLPCTMLAACITRSGELPPAPAVAVAAISFTHDVVYTPASWPSPQRGDLYVPEGRGRGPAIVTVHGGGWDARDRTDMERVANELARRGYLVLNIDYRLAPAHHFPAALDDVHQAVHWLRGNAARLNVDPDRIGVWGYSAGGHLAALAATRRQEPGARIAAVVAGGTPSDLPHYPKSPIITRFIGATFAQRPATWTDASPLAHVDSLAPPMFLYHGTWDRLVDVEDTVRLHNALVAVGVPSELYLIDGAGHIPTFLFGFGAVRAGIDFLDAVLRPDRTS